MEIERAIRILIDSYYRALHMEEGQVDDPVSFAGFMVMNEARKEKENKNNGKKTD